MAGIRVENTRAGGFRHQCTLHRYRPRGRLYHHQPLEKIGLQTDQPLKRALHPLAASKMI